MSNTTNENDPIIHALDRRICERRGRYRNLSGRQQSRPKPLAEAEHQALNGGADLLRHALGGAAGTVNGASVDSAAAVLAQALSARMDATG